MENLLNPDGSPSFTNVSELRTNFEESFAKKQLGATMKDIVVKSLNNIDDKNSESVLSDEKIRHMVHTSISEISDKCYTNEELNGSSYLGGLRNVVKEYAGMEADYRENIANAILHTNNDKLEASKKVFELFSVENLSFMSKEIKDRFSAELESSYAMEAEDIVTEIGKEVGGAIAEAEEKNVIINETSKVIQDKKDEIREELSSDDNDEDDEKANNSNNGDFDDSEDDGEEPTIESETPDGESDDNETSTESFEQYGLEKLFDNSEERMEAFNQINKDKGKIKNQISGVYDLIVNNVKDRFQNYDIDDDDMVLYRNYFKDKNEFLKVYDNRFELAFMKLKKHNKTKFSIPILRVRGKLLPANIQFISKFFDIIGTKIINKFNADWFLLNYDEKKERKIRRAVKHSFDYNDIKVKDKVTPEGHYMNHTISIEVSLKVKKIALTGGLEDYDNEVSEIEERLDDSVIADVENGKITIGDIDPTATEIDNADTESIQVSEHTDDTGNEEPEAVPDKITVSDVSETPDSTFEETPGEIDVGTEEFNRVKYGNENLAKVIVPLSPTRLDMLEIPSARSLGTVYAKAVESLGSLENVISSRFDILADIVEREHDEDLSKKFKDYKSRAMEGFEDARQIRRVMDTIGITSYGIGNTSDPTSVFIGAKTYKYFDGTLGLKNKTPKVSFKSMEDAIDAAFDIILVKDAARRAKDKDTLVALSNNLQSREDLFWNNIVDLNDDEHKDQIKGIIQLGDLDIDKKALVDNQYLTSIEIGLDTIKVKTPSKSEDEINEEIFNKSKEKIESFLGKDMNADQLEIVKAMIEGRDTSDYAPTPFEKFVIKLGTDKVIEKDGGKDFELGQESAEEVRNKAIVLCTLDTFVNMLNPMNGNDTKEFKEYINK